MMNSHTYHNHLWRTFAEYRRTAFPGDDALFEDRVADGTAPTVFKRMHATRNILVPCDASPQTVKAIQDAVAPADRHTWFSSLSSSQALCQSVFAGLRETGHIRALRGLLAEDGRVAFGERGDDWELTLEHKVKTLNEPRPTSIDAFFHGTRRIAVEVKFAESEFGTCSRPRLKANEPHYERDHCDGNFSMQRDRSERCSLTSQGIRYWEHIPRFLTWYGDSDCRPCPLAQSYQLVRNLLAANLDEKGSLSSPEGHVLVIYDDRNPAFASGGKACAQWIATFAASRFPHMLRKLSWQRIAGHLAGVAELRWLVDGLRLKYGIVASNPGVAA